MSIKPTKVFILWIWATFFIPFIVWPTERELRPINATRPLPNLLPTLRSNTPRPPTEPEASLAKTLADFILVTKQPYPPQATYNSLSEAFKNTENLSDEVAEDLGITSMNLFLELIQEGKKLEKEKSPQEFAYLLNGKKINLGSRAEGVAELNSVDGIKFHRVIPHGTETSIIFLNAERVNPESSHLKRIKASQHIDAGRSRQDGQTGRDFYIVWYENGNERGFSRVTRVESYLRFKEKTKGWFRDEILASCSPINLDQTLVMGVIVGAFAQGYQVLGLNHLEMAMGRSHELATNQILWTMCFGGLCGTFSPWLRKFINRPRSDFSQLMRNIVITSAPFAIPFIGLDPEKGWGVFNPLTTLGWMTYAGLSVHFVVNNLTKGQISKMIKVLNDERVNTKKYFGASVADWQQQASNYGITMPTRLIDLAGILGTIPIALGIIHFDLPGGKALLLGIWPIAKYGYTRLAEHLKTDDAVKIRQDWERSIFGFLLGLPIGTVADTALFGATYTKDLFKEDLGDSDRFLRKLSSRWHRQKWAPSYFAGKTIEVTGRIITPKDESKDGSLRQRCGTSLAKLGLQWQQPFLSELKKMAKK